MLYVIVCLIKDEAHQYHETLVEKVCTQFGVKRQKLQSHFTIKAPFEAENIQQLEQITSDFCERNTESEFTMDGYGHFGDRVAYMDIQPSHEMVETCSKYVSELRKIPWLQWKSNEKGSRIFHCTVVSKLSKGKFDGIWHYLSNHSFNFRCKFDNITVMRWDKDKWTIHKSFLLKK